MTDREKLVELLLQEDDFCKLSECQDCKFERDLFDNWKEVQALTPNCPNCGAKMDLEVTNDA